MKYARVFLKGNDNPLRWIDFPLEGGTFAQFCIGVRIQGCIMPTMQVQAWVPFGEIKFMVEITAGQPLTFSGIPEGRPN